MIVIEGNNSSPAFMRPSSSVIAEERSMMQTILSGKDPSFSTGLGIVLTPFAKNVSIIYLFLYSRLKFLVLIVLMVFLAVRIAADISIVLLSLLIMVIVSFVTFVVQRMKYLSIIVLL